MASNDFSAWRLIVVAAAIFLGSMIVAAIVTAPFLIMAGGEDRSKFIFLMYVLQFSLTCSGVWWWMARRGGVRLRLGVGWAVIPIALGGMVLLTAVGIVIEPLLELFPDRYLEGLNEMIGKGVGMTILVAVVAPVLEELLFRGLLLEGLLRRWGAAAAVTVSAALFGAAHLPNFPQALNAFVLAAVMGYIYVLSGRRLVPVILIHAANNALSVVMVHLMGSQVISTRELVGNDALYAALYAVCVVVFIGSMAVMVRSARNKTAETTLQQGT